MQIPRLTRWTNAFTKKLEKPLARALLALRVLHFCRVHTTLRITPAMEPGRRDRVWSIAE